MVRGEADALLYTSLEVTYLLTRPQYKDITFLTEYQDHEDDRLALSPSMPPQLLSILNKTLNDLDERDKSQIISDNISSMVAPSSLKDLLYEHRAAILLAVELVLFLAVFATYAAYLRRRSHRATQESERRLSALTANINGGVISLLADPSLHIAQANTGFWRLLGHSAPPQEDALVTWLPPEDADRLRAAMSNSTTALSLELRLRHRGQTWLPVLLRGAPAPGEDGPAPLFHCVVVDITEQKHMQDELEQEKNATASWWSNPRTLSLMWIRKNVSFSAPPTFSPNSGARPPPCSIPAAARAMPMWCTPTTSPPCWNCAAGSMRANTPPSASCAFPPWRAATSGAAFRSRASAGTARRLRLIGKIVDIDEEVRRRAELERRSQRDSLTDLLNKAAFREQVRSCMPARPEGNRTDALMFMDLDNFKVLNDTLGHVVGDVALVDVAEALKRTFRNVDILGRFGGDEFCIFLRGHHP